MGEEINLLDFYPTRIRNTKERAKIKTKKQIKIAKKFGWEYFDKKDICYGGYSYDGRWIPIAKRLINYYKLKKGDKILDVGCGKGYLVYDLVNLGIDAYGVDISEYAIDSAPDSIQTKLYLCDAKDLSFNFNENQFDLVISINTIHNLLLKDCKKAIKEIQKIGKNAFIVVDSYRNKEEKKRMMDWNITGETIRSVKNWKKLFKEVGYTGDYYWFIP